MDYLRERLRRGRASHAYLLTGPPQVGKLTTALALAQLLLCAQETACGRCRHCALAGRRIHPDLRVLQIPPDRKTIPIKDVHEFIQGMALKPLEATRKVYIVDSADRLSEDGANAFLKTLEEPPPSVTLILTATDPARLLPTVVSRCQQLRLQRVPAAEIEQFLITQHGLSGEAAADLAQASRGRPGWALLALQEPERLAARAQRLQDLERLLAASRLDRIQYADRLAEQWGPRAEEALSTLETWLDAWRQKVRALTRAQEPRRPIGLSLAQAREGLRATLHAIEALQANAHPRLTLEGLLLRWPRVDAPAAQARAGSEASRAL